MNEAELDVDAYAALAARLAAPGADRASLLAEQGLDEEAWNALDDRWQERLSRAEDEHGDRDGVPPLVARFADAFGRAQRGASNELCGLDRYVEITRALCRGRDVAEVLARHQLPLDAYLRAHQHWTLRLATDLELAKRIRRLLG